MPPLRPAGLLDRVAETLGAPLGELFGEHDHKQIRRWAYGPANARQT
jgi:hypothetical protein